MDNDAAEVSFKEAISFMLEQKRNVSKGQGQQEKKEKGYQNQSLKCQEVHLLIVRCSSSIKSTLLQNRVKLVK